MQLIGFSHHYKKLHGQEFGTLLAVDKIDVSEETIPFQTRAYDTEYCDIWGCSKYHPFPYELGDICLRLTFIGNYGIPFTTYREVPTNYVPFGKQDSDFHFSVPYVELLRCGFAFKFKGEELPKELADKVESTENCVKIF